MALDPAFLAQPIAHRGLHGLGVPENSLAAIEAAVAGGFGIEIDVQPSADGVPMVFHDYRLERLTDAAGDVAARDAEALGRIGLLGTSQQIPTLAAVLQAVAGQVPLLIEIKDQDGAMGRNVGGLSQAVGDLVAGYAGPVAVMSFNPHHIAELACAKGLVTCDFARRHWGHVPSDRLAALRDILDAEAVGAAFISHQWQDLARPRVGALKAQGLAVLTWTIRSRQEEATARQIAQNVTFEGYDPG